MTLLISCGWVIIGQCVKFVWSLLTCVCRLLTIDLCLTTMESYHQFADVTIWYRLLIGQEASKCSMKHDDVSRYDKSQGWLGWERVHDMSWLPMNNDCMRSMHIVMSYWWGEAFWIISTIEHFSTTWTFIALKLHNTQTCSLQGESENAYSVSQSAQSYIEHGYGSSFLQIRRDVEQPNVVYVRRNRHMRKLT